MHHRYRLGFIAIITATAFFLTSCAMPKIFDAPAAPRTVAKSKAKPKPAAKVVTAARAVVKAPVAATAVKPSVVLTNYKEGYSFRFPKGWRLDNDVKIYMANRGTQEDFSDFGAPPSKLAFELNVSANKAIATAAGLCGKVIIENNVLKGNQWVGNYFACSGQSPKTKQTTTEVFYTVKHRNKYYLFWLSVPVKFWANDHRSYIAMMQSLQFKNP